MTSDLRRVLFVGDTHADDRTPESRKDDYLLATLEELDECVQIAHDRKCDIVFHLGDVFHRIEPAPECRNGVIRSLIASKIPWYTLIGNHDVRHNPQLLPESALGTLIDADVLRCEPNLPEYGILCEHFRSSLDTELANGHLADKPWLIVACHASITTSPAHGSFVLAKDVKTHPSTRLLVSGHIHYPLEEKLPNGLHFVNPGSTCRNRMDEDTLKRMPQVLLAEYSLDGSHLELEYIPLKSSKPAADIFRIEVVRQAKAEKADTQSFVRQVTNMKLGFGDDDICEAVKKSGKLKQVNDKVVDLAVQILREMNDKRK